MHKIVLNIKIKYDTFSCAEKKIADYLFENSLDILDLFITDLAAKCDVSEATIVRFVKKLGFSGYPQFKLAIAQEIAARPIADNITDTDSPFDIFTKVCEDIYYSLEKTKNTISQKALTDCCKKLLAAEKIFIFGLGNSASIALDVAHKLFRLGLNAVAYTDNHLQAIASAHTNERMVVLGISHSGRSKDIVQSLKTAKENGAVTISLTSDHKSPIVRASDIVLYTVADETNYRILALNSRITQLAIIDTIYSYLVCHIPMAEEQIAQTESALRSKKV